MKLTKEDFMRLPKERLAELLVEMQDQIRIETIQVPTKAPNPYQDPEPWRITCGIPITGNISTTSISKEEAETKVWN